MPRLQTLDALLFDVALQPVFTTVGLRTVPVPEARAVVSMPAGRVLGVVGRDYRLVSHAQALALAHDCVRAVFPETRPGEWQVAQVDAPSTGSACCIDLAHGSGALDFSALPAADKPEVYGPFVRVTNSYNRSRALCFDIGYMRKVCRNGLILRSAVVSFRMNHQRREIGEAVKFEVARERLARQQQEFGRFLARLQACPVPAEDIAGFASGVLGFRPPPADKADADTRWAAWQALQQQVDAAGARYAQELGANAHAVLNVVTELASRPPDNPLVRRDRHALQRRAGEWVIDFSSRCGEPGFDLRRYLASLEGGGAAGSPARLRTAPAAAPPPA